MNDLVQNSWNFYIFIFQQTLNISPDQSLLTVVTCSASAGQQVIKVVLVVVVDKKCQKVA